QCAFAKIPLVGALSQLGFFSPSECPRRRSYGLSQSCRCIYTSLVGYGGGIGSVGWGPPGFFTWQITELQVPFRVSEHWFPPRSSIDQCEQGLPSISSASRLKMLHWKRTLLTAA